MKERVARGVKRSRKKNPALLAAAALLALAAVGAAFALDGIVGEWQRANHAGAWREFAQACSRYGDWPPLAGAVVVAAIVARFFKARRAVMVLCTMLAASVLAGAIVNPLRVATGRARPVEKVESGWHGMRRDGKWLAGKYAYSSFPSAHTTVAFAFATPLFLAGWRAGLCGWFVAALIGWSRIELGAHHPSDVVVGAMLGWACGWVLVRSANVRWWTWRMASAACGLRSRWPRASSRCRLPLDGK
ncbi:MAG TPA: phosphatase PAP2 family protein [Chthoniobacteraceae bacterium]|nr:phosphatase PAP2 family protein [Chthoniobacteraceae bacterium]